jgi:hypothetical protein
MNKIGTWILKNLLRILAIPEGDAIDFSAAKMGKVTHKAATSDDFKRIEAVKAGVEHLKKLKQQMEEERYEEEMKVYERIIKEKKSI